MENKKKHREKSNATQTVPNCDTMRHIRHSPLSQSMKWIRIRVQYTGTVPRYCYNLQVYEEQNLNSLLKVKGTFSRGFRPF